MSDEPQVEMTSGPVSDDRRRIPPSGTNAAAVTVGARIFLSALVERVVKDKNVDSGSVLKSIENVVAEKCNDLGGTLQTALKI